MCWSCSTGGERTRWPSAARARPPCAGWAARRLAALAPLMPAPEPGRDVRVLLDGVGADLLAEPRALPPTLRRLEGETAWVRTVAPSTTATAMVSLHTGLPPLQHGVLGYLTH